MTTNEIKTIITNSGFIASDDELEAIRDSINRFPENLQSDIINRFISDLQVNEIHKAISETQPNITNPLIAGNKPNPNTLTFQSKINNNQDDQPQQSNPG